jgi:Helix-turn-helix domain
VPPERESGDSVPDLPNDRSQEFLLETEAARLLRLSGRTLQRHRQAGTGPAYRRLDRRVVYARRELLEWADGCRRLSTADPVRP